MGKVRIRVSGAKRRNTPVWAKSWLKKYPAAARRVDEAGQSAGLIRFRRSALKVRKKNSNSRPTPSRDFDLFRGRSSRACGEGFAAGFVAGHSLGEYSALVAAGFAEVCGRGAARAEARGRICRRRFPRGRRDGGDHGIVPRGGGDACKRAAEGEACARRNLNSPNRTVIFRVWRAAVKASRGTGLAGGGERAVILPVSAPFHSALMMPAQEKAGKGFAQYGVLEFVRVPLVTNVDADTIDTATKPRGADPPGDRAGALERIRAPPDR